MRFIILLISLLIIGQTDAKDINVLTPYLKNSVSISDQKKVNKLKKKASKKSKASDKAKYYLKAAQLGDYESQVAMGYYYGFGVCYPRAIEVDEENMTIKNKSSHQAINRNAAKYFFDNACKNEDVSYHMEQASLGLVLLSLDSITNKKIAEEMYLTLLLCAVGLEEQMENDRQIYNQNWERRVLCENTGKLLATMSLNGIGTNRNLLNAHYYSLWAGNYLNMPNSSPRNKLSQQIIRTVGSLPINEESKKYGAGLVSAVLLKRAADLYQKDVQDREILFWVERSLFTDTLNSKAYYFAGHLYKYGAAGLRRSRNIAKQWFEKAAELGSQEGQAALNEIERREREERVQDSEYRQRREEMKRQKRRQIWAQAIGTLVQAAGSAYLYSQGYSPSNNALNIGSSIHQAQSQYSSQQIPFQNIQMPQFDFNWTKPPTFTIDWSQVNWSSVPIDTYYQYQGDLIKNGAGTTIISENDNSSFTNAGSSFEKTCPLCHGTKKCWTCYGKMTFINPLTGKEIACPNCSDGLCSKCHGSGKL